MGRLHPLDWLVLALYVVLALGVSVLLTRRASSSTREFYLAGRTLPWWIAGTSLVATSFAADTPLLVSGWVRTGGISLNWLWWGMAVGHALVTIVVAAWWRRAEVTTDAEFIERRYAGRQARVLRGFYGGYHALVTNTIVLTWVLTAMIKLVRVVLDLPDDRADALIVGGALVLALSYSLLAGLWGVVLTDLFQFVLAVGGALLLAWKSVAALGGLDAARAHWAELPTELTRIVPAPEGDWSALAWWTTGFGAFLVYFGVQGWLNKNADGGGQAVQRFSACRDEHHARGTMLWFSLAHYCIRPWPWIVVGLASLTLVAPEHLPMLTGADGVLVPDHEAAYPLMMAQLLGPGLFGLLCASFLAAFMSTLDTHFNLASAYVVNDLYRRFLRPGRSERHYVWAGRAAELTVGVLAATFALATDSISDLFTLSLGLLGGLGPALLMRWFWWRANAWTEIAALTCSTLLTVLGRVPLPGVGVVLPVPYPLSYAMVVGASAAVALLVTLATRPADRAALQRFHDQVLPSGLWRPFRVGRRLRNRALPILIGWAAGAVLVQGLLFGIGRWLLGRECWPAFVAAAGAALALAWAWPRALHPLPRVANANGKGSRPDL